MIRIILGEVGSGKTACMVREIINNKDNKTNYSNIILKNIKKPNYVLINRDMIVKKENETISKNGKISYTLTFNKDFWIKLRDKKKSINIILDEAHNLMNARNSMSKINKIMSSFLSMIRRILGSSTADYGELILITQLGRRLDVIARESATSVQYHKAHYLISCKDCGYTQRECNEDYEPLKNCPNCESTKLYKHHYIMEVFKFKSVDDVEYWRNFEQKTYYSHYYITDIEKYFKYYDTLQWNDMITEFDD